MSNVFLFKSYCSNLYCSILWYDCSKTALKTLRIANNNSLRKLLGIAKYNSASEMFVCLNIPSFNELLRKYDCRLYSFRSRLLLLYIFIHSKHDMSTISNAIQRIYIL